MKIVNVILVSLALLTLTACYSSQDSSDNAKNILEKSVEPSNQNYSKTSLKQAYKMDLSVLEVDESLKSSEYAMYAHEGKKFIKALEDGTVSITPEHYFKHDKLSGEIYGYSYDAPYDDIKELVIPSMIDGNVVTGIRYESFIAMDLNKVVLPNTIKTIGNNAFEANNLTELHLPHGVEEIGRSAFQINQLTEIILPNSLTKIDEKAFNSNDIKEVYLGSDLLVGGYKVFDWNKVDIIVNESSLTLKNIGYMLDIKNDENEKQTGVIDRGKNPIQVIR